MAVEVKIPEVGESITEGFLAEWSQPDGAVVAVEDPLLVLETDKITMTVNAEDAGKLTILVAEGETVEVGQVVAPSTPTSPSQCGVCRKRAAGTRRLKQSEEPPAEAPRPAAPAPAAAPDHSGLSPAVQRLVVEHDLDPGNDRRHRQGRADPQRRRASPPRNSRDSRSHARSGRSSQSR